MSHKPDGRRQLMEKDKIYKLIKPVVLIIYIVLGIIAFKLFVEYALKWISPFLIGYLLSRAALPLARWLCKKLKLRFKFSAFLGITVVILFCFVCIGILVYFLYTWLMPFFSGLSKTYADLSVQLSASWEKLLGAFSFLPPGIRDSIEQALTNIPRNIDFVNLLVKPLLSILGNFPLMILTVIATVVSTFFFVYDDENISAFTRKLLSPALYERINRMYTHLSRSLFRWVRAQVILASICFVELLVGFLILGMKQAFLLALVIAFVDFLPILGAGTVLIPWSLISLLLGNFKHAIGLGAMYVVILLVRNTLEPNIVGQQIGMHPLVTLLGMYVGFRMFGFIGMFILPLALIMIIQLNEWGYIKLWETDTPQIPPDIVPEADQRELDLPLLILPCLTSRGYISNLLKIC